MSVVSSSGVLDPHVAPVSARSGAIAPGRNTAAAPAASPTIAPQPMRDGRHSISRTHLANERTFLAWVRTAMSVVALGLAVAAFLGGTGAGSPLHDALAIGLVASGAALLMTGLVRFRAAANAINHDRTINAGSTLISVTTGVVTAASLFGVIYIVLH